MREQQSVRPAAPPVTPSGGPQLGKSAGPQRGNPASFPLKILHAAADLALPRGVRAARCLACRRRSGLESISPRARRAEVESEDPVHEPSVLPRLLLECVQAVPGQSGSSIRELI